MTTITRRKAAAPPAASAYSDSASNSISPSNQNDRDDRARDDEQENDDDKETRLTLMEEVLLLGLKDREVCFFSIEGKSICDFHLGLHILLERLYFIRSTRLYLNRIRFSRSS